MKKDLEINIVGADDCMVEEIQTFLFEQGYHWGIGGRCTIHPIPYKNSVRKQLTDCVAIVTIDEKIFFSENLTTIEDFPNRVRTTFKKYKKDIIAALS